MVQARVEAKSDFQDQLRDLFTHFDKDSNGYLDEYEFTELVRCSFPYSISKRQAEGMYRKGMELRAELVVRVAAVLCRAGGSWWFTVRCLHVYAEGQDSLGGGCHGGLVGAHGGGGMSRGVTTVVNGTPRSHVWPTDFDGSGSSACKPKRFSP